MRAPLGALLIDSLNRYLYADRVRAPYQQQQQQPSAVEESAAVYPGSEPDRSINPYYNPDTGSHRYGFVISCSEHLSQIYDGSREIQRF